MYIFHVFWVGMSLKHAKLYKDRLQTIPFRRVRMRGQADKSWTIEEFLILLWSCEFKNRWALPTNLTEKRTLYRLNRLSRLGPEMRTLVSQNGRTLGKLCNTPNKGRKVSYLKDLSLNFGFIYPSSSPSSSLFYYLW